MSNKYIIGANEPDDGVVLSWALWKKSNGDAAWITGDPDYGKLATYRNDICLSNVIDTEVYGTKILHVDKNVYGTGSGIGPTISIRGSNDSFDYDATSPEWEEYIDGMRRQWRYMQLKTETIGSAYEYEWVAWDYDPLSPLLNDWLETQIFK